MMKLLRSGWVVIWLCMVSASVAQATPKGDPLFINMTTQDAHRALMAISFGKNQLDRGHPLTLFLNDGGVLVANTANADKYPEQQKLLSATLAAGGKVLICAMCMQKYGVKAAQVLPGIQVSNPDITGAALFAPDTRTLSW